MTVATVLVAIAYSVSDGAVLRILLIDAAMLLLIGILPLYRSVAMARMSGLMAAAGLAFINTVGLLGGFVGPYLYGLAESRGSESIQVRRARRRRRPRRAAPAGAASNGTFRGPEIQP